MASFAEIMMQQAGESSQKVGQGLAQSFATGFDLALKQEQVNTQREELEMKKSMLKSAKLEKFAEAMEKASKFKGSAQKNYTKNFLPKYRDSLGLTDMFPDESLAFVSSTPETQGKFRTIVAQVRAGHMTEEQAIKLVNDPISFADLDITPDESYKLLGEASKTAIENNQELKKQRNQFDQQTNEAEVARNATGQVELAKKTAQKFTEWDGGAGHTKKVEALSRAIKTLKEGKVEFGTLAKQMPFGSSLEVLARTDPNAKALIDDILGSVNIKQETGDPNPTEKQINAILSRMIDGRLDNKKNIEKLEAEMKREKSAENQRVQEFQKAGFLPAGRASQGGGEKQAPPPPPPTFDVNQAKSMLSKAVNAADLKKREQWILEKYGEAALKQAKGQ